MALMLGAVEVADLRRTAEDGIAHGAPRVLVDCSMLLALLDDRDFLRAALIRQEFDVVEALAEAQGMPRDPEYGYPTGDHTAETMARSMIDYCARLRAASVRSVAP